MSKMIDEMKELIEKIKHNTTYFSIGYIVGVYDCIDIVKKHKKKKKGKCEWVKANEDIFINPHNEVHLSTYNFDYKYCPYCGKKIDVKESE